MLVMTILSLSFVACNHDDPKTDEPLENTVISGLIEENTTWSADQIYELNGRVIVTDGVTLTIEPRTIIKGQNQTGVNALQGQKF